MSNINNVGLNSINAPQNVNNSQNRGYSYLLNQPIQDSVEFSTAKKPENKGILNQFQTLMSDAVRKFQLHNDAEKYMDKFFYLLR